jgi:hypothetical protein
MFQKLLMWEQCSSWAMMRDLEDVVSSRFLLLTDHSIRPLAVYQELRYEQWHSWEGTLWCSMNFVGPSLLTLLHVAVTVNGAVTQLYNN